MGKVITGFAIIDGHSAMSIEINRFQVFYESSFYSGLKNLLYNYRLRKRSVTRHLRGACGPILEIGSGLSPMITGCASSVVYTDLSFSALWLLRHQNPNGLYVVADANCLPFASEAFQNTVCSEVFEHIENDFNSIEELARVMTIEGRLVATFPHRQCYFANDDRYVSHFRRYEFTAMNQKLKAAGFRVRHVEKVLGPLEKATMMAVIGFIVRAQKFKMARRISRESKPVPRWLIRLFDIFNRFYSGLVWLDATVMPQSAASVMLVVAEKESMRK